MARNVKWPIGLSCLQDPGWITWTPAEISAISDGMGKPPRSPRKIAGVASSARALSLYQGVLLIRRVEESLKTLFAEGLVPGFIHLSIGQEAVAAGVMSVLGPDDTVASTHRGHGHAVARGMALPQFFAELMARSGGVCAGRGGSMHVADLAKGFLGANGIVAAGLPLALGSALAHRTLGRSAIAVPFFGDGALAEGLVHESLNLAALWKLPVLFVCENNGWGEFLPTSHQIAFTLADLAKAYGIAYRQVDGNDVAAVASVAREAARHARDGHGPIVLECLTERFGGHYEGDPQRGRDRDELAALAGRDPVAIARRQAIATGADEAACAAIESEIDSQIAEAIAWAKASPPPSWDDAASAVYTPTGPA